MRLYIDFKSPASWLAMKPTLALAARCKAEIEYLPFRTSQKPVPPKQADETVGTSHRRTRAASRRNIHLKYAAVQGIPMNFPAAFADTDLALAALLYVRPEPLPFVQAAFTAYWAAGADLNDRQVIDHLLNAQGYDAKGFDAGRYLEDLEIHLMQAEEAGVIDAPTYLIAEQMFVGREHLPWIETLLGGEVPKPSGCVP